VTTELILPKFNMDMDTAVLVRWLVADGDRVSEGDAVAEVETDKVNMEVEATAEGILCGLRFAPGDVVPVTVPIASIAPDEAAAAHVRSSISSKAPAAEASSGAGTAERPTAGTSGKPEGEAPGRVRATPAVRRLAREHGIDLATVAGDGGRVTPAALHAAIDQRAGGATPASKRSARSRSATATGPVPMPASAPPTDSSRIPLDATRRVIAERMTKASQIPQITLRVEVRAGALVKIRDASVARPSFSAIFAIAVAKALRDHTVLNSTFEDEMVVTHAAVDLGIAVARPGGLIVPVLRNADRLTVLGADGQIRDLIARARDGQLRLDEVSGGSFTITSLGEAGIDSFTPLLNPPQVAILAIGRLTPRVVPIDGGIVIEPTVQLSLACDHRVIDGAPGAAFLASLRRLLEAPEWLAASLEIP